MNAHDVTLLGDIALSLIFATLAAHVARLLRQPLILGYIAGGVLLGSHVGFGLVCHEASIELISEIGLIFLLFIIGLEIRIPELARMGGPMFGLGIVQFAGCAAFMGLLAGPLLGYPATGGKFDLVYLAVTASLSSTLIVVKLLHDKFEAHTPSGRMTIGVLVLQDLWAIGFMAFQPNLQSPEASSILRSLGLGTALIAAAFLLSRYVLAKIFKHMARTPELVLLSAIAWCFFVSGAAEKAGLSKEMGALIAGLSIAAFPYGADIIAKLSGIRDFFVTLFFVSLGLKMPAPTLGLFASAVALAFAVVASRLLTVLPAAAVFGQGFRLGAVTALNLAQISEFSLVILALGTGYGHISDRLASEMLMAMLLASVMASYLIVFNDRITTRLLGVLHTLGLRHAGRHAHTQENKEKPRDIVLLGCFRWGMDLVDKIAAKKPELRERTMVADFNATLKEPLEARGFRFAYADLAHSETLEHLDLGKASLVVCTLPDTFLKGTTTPRLLRQLKHLAPNARILMTADDTVQAETLKKEGAEDVLVLSDLAGNKLFEMLTQD